MTISCQKVTKPTISKYINASTVLNSYGYIPTKTSTATLTDTSGNPISGAIVTVEQDTLFEIEPGKYRYSVSDVYTIPDTFKLVVKDQNDNLTVQVPTPVPHDLDIVYSGQGHDITAVWRSHDLFAYYEVDVKYYPNDTLIYQTFIRDTTVVIPGEILPEEGEILVFIWVVTGPRLDDGDIVPNISQDGWEGTYAVKIGNYFWVSLQR